MASPAARMTSQPTAELPVKLIMSMRGSVVSSLAASRPDGRDDIDHTGRDIGLLVDDARERKPGERGQR